MARARHRLLLRPWDGSRPNKQSRRHRQPLLGRCLPACRPLGPRRAIGIYGSPASFLECFLGNESLGKLLRRNHRSLTPYIRKQPTSSGSKPQQRDAISARLSGEKIPAGTKDRKWPAIPVRSWHIQPGWLPRQIGHKLRRFGPLPPTPPSPLHSQLDNADSVPLRAFARF